MMASSATQGKGSTRQYEVPGIRSFIVIYLAYFYK